MNSSETDHVLRAIAENRAVHLCVDNEHFFLRYSEQEIKFATDLTDFSEELNQYVMTVNVQGDIDLPDEETVKKAYGFVPPFVYYSPSTLKTYYDPRLAPVDARRIMMDCYDR